VSSYAKCSFDAVGLRRVTGRTFHHRAQLGRLAESRGIAGAAQHRFATGRPSLSLGNSPLKPDTLGGRARVNDMQAASHWKVWLDARTPEAGRRVTSRIAEKLGLELVNFSIEPYPKGGFVAVWTCFHDVADSNAAIVATIGCGQKLANGWGLSGSVHDELEGSVSKAGHNHISIAGVTMLTWRVSVTERPG